MYLLSKYLWKLGTDCTYSQRSVLLLVAIGVAYSWVLSAALTPGIQSVPALQRDATVLTILVRKVPVGPRQSFTTSLNCIPGIKRKS